MFDIQNMHNNNIFSIKSYKYILFRLKKINCLIVLHNFFEVGLHFLLEIKSKLQGIIASMSPNANKSTLQKKKKISLYKF